MIFSSSSRPSSQGFPNVSLYNEDAPFLKGPVFKSGTRTRSQDPYCPLSRGARSTSGYQQGSKANAPISISAALAGNKANFMNLMYSFKRLLSVYVIGRRGSSCLAENNDVCNCISSQAITSVNTTGHFTCCI